jgi:hypothetical protein
MRTKLIVAKSRLHDEQGFLDLFTLSLIAVAVILLVAFLFGGIIAFLGSALVIGGLICLFFLYPIVGLVMAGVGLIMVIASIQLHMGYLHIIFGGIF